MFISKLNIILRKSNINSFYFVGVKLKEKIRRVSKK